MNEHLNMPVSNIARFSPVVNTGRAYNDGSRHHASANKEYFTSASSAQWQCGTGDFEIGRWCLFDTVSSQDVIKKDTEYSLEVLTNKFRFGVYAGSAWTYVTANTFGAISATTWYFVRCWIDRTAGTINISVNNGTADSVSTTAPTAGSAGVVVGKGSAGFYNGRWDSQYVTKRLSTAGEAAITYNAGNGQTGLLMSTANPTRFADIDIWHDGNEADGTAYDIIGTNHLTATADPIIAPPVYGSELIGNGGFETIGGYSFVTWAEAGGGGGVVSEEATIIHSGSHAAKVTYVTTSSRVEQNIAVTSGANYYYSFWSRGDGANSGQYFIYDLSNSANMVTISTTNNPTTTYQLFTGQFTAPAGCTSVRLALYSPATAGYAYFDDVSVKQITTASINNGGFDERPATGGEKTNVSTVSRSRTSNVATMVATAHGLKNNDVVTITGMTDTTFNGTNKTVTVVDVDTFTYASTGSDAGSAADTGGRIATDVFSSWNETTIDASTINAETTAPYAGSYAAILDTDASNSLTQLANPVMIIGKNYTLSLYAKINDITGTPSMSVAGLDGADKTITLTASYAQYTLSGLASGTSIIAKRNSGATASKSIYIDQVTLTSMGPTSDAGIASGLALNTNGISKVLNDGWNAGSFAQITLAKRPLFSTAYFGGCVLFDGVDDGLVMTGDKIGTGDVTVCSVIRPTGWGGGGGGVILHNRSFHLRVFTTNSLIQVSSNYTTFASSATNSISLNSPYVIIATRTSSGIINIYINGLLSGTANQNPSLPIAGGDTYIGNREAFDRAFAGYIGKVGVINRILSIGDIQAMSRWLSIQNGGIF